ncbi:MAG TPA: Hsp33 family molecular chaperone HslO [Bacilli bacterium]|nr:Hsp33 family molecular chaperone HslO [Bacilli bacterium]
MDYLIKGLALDNNIRVYIANTTDTINELKKRHDLWPGALSVLGKTLTITSIMGGMLKENHRVSVAIKTNGQVGNVYADAYFDGRIRGYLQNPHVNFINHQDNTLDDRFSLGSEGIIQVIKDLNLKAMFTSQVPLTYFDLAKDFAYYFNTSEHTPSAVSVGVLVGEDNYAIASGGFVIQLMPQTPEYIIDFLEDRINELPPMSKLLNTHQNLEDILTTIFGSNYQIIEKLPLKFTCSCSKERFANGIVSLGKEEITQIIEEQGDIETVCHYCREKYYFNKDELLDLLNKSK